jgi:ParB family chromosome partitioning protein
VELHSRLAGNDRLALFAHCVSLSVNALQVRGQHDSEALSHAGMLVRETGLDMTAYWRPNAANYLTRVSKECILEALREGGTGDIETIARLKKPAMAAAAEAALPGKGWLPQLLRMPDQQARCLRKRGRRERPPFLLLNQLATRNNILASPR